MLGGYFANVLRLTVDIHGFTHPLTCSRRVTRPVWMSEQVTWHQLQ